MLILTRRAGETLTIGDDGEIKLTVLDINRKQVRVGVTASKDVPIHRQEIYQRIQAEKNSPSEADKE